MNNKKTNCLVIILDIVLIAITYVLLYIGEDVLNNSFIYINTELKSVYGNFFMDFIANNMNLIMIIAHSLLALFNIVCAIQNRENKKICFWQVLFGLYEIYFALIVLDVINLDKLVYKILFAGIPIILTIINVISCLRKNKIAMIKIILYIGIIFISVLTIFDIFDKLKIYGSHWQIIILLMLFIYIFKQDKEVEEGKTRKRFNIIFYYVIQLIVVMVVSVSLILLIVLSKINKEKWDSEIENIYGEIINLNEITNSELYMPVKNNGKYGYINEKGQEKIKCEYDRVSYFVNANINGKNCYFALVEQGDKYYIISKSNQKLDLGNQQYIKQIEDNCKIDSKDFKNDDVNTTFFSYVLIAFGQVKFNMEDMQQIIVEESQKNTINLVPKYEEKEDLYYENEYTYDNGKYTLIVKPIQSGDKDYKDDDNYKVTIKKKNGEENSTTEKLPTYNYYNTTILPYTDGAIPFESLDGKIKGYYDINGSKKSLNKSDNDYEIIDVKNDKIIIYIYESSDKTKENNYYIFDIDGKIYLEAKLLIDLNGVYLVKNKENKMELYDEYLNMISDKYDMILPNTETEILLYYQANHQ